MAFDEGLAERLRKRLAGRSDLTERKMFGGIAFLLHGNLCCGVIGERLMVRVGPEQYDDALRRPFAHEMDFTGRPMRGFVYVASPGYAESQQLDDWLDLALTFVTTLPAK